MTDTFYNQNNTNSHNMIDNRQSESPARTIDSHDSTIDSMDTIVDRSLNREEIVTTTIEQSTNTTNMDHGSLTNSLKSMLQQQHNIGEEEKQLQQHQQHQHFDAQSHIYSSPVYDEKPQHVVTMEQQQQQHHVDMPHEDANKLQFIDEDLNKHKLISHKEFQHQLEQAMAARVAATTNGNSKDQANTLDSRISKKQRLPAEFIKFKDGNSERGSTASVKQRRSSMSSSSCCSAFPLQIILGTLQLVLAVSLVALGSLLIVRDAAMSMAGCGIWTGLIAAITGSLGVVSIRKTQTAFLALSLVCIATSTLALAISGVGLTRDINRLEEEKEKFDLMNANGEISAASGLIFALFLHFVVSIISVYRCALQICNRSKAKELQEVIIKSKAAGIPIDQEQLAQYMKALGANDKENAAKIANMMLYSKSMTSLPQASMRKMPLNNRPIMLIPATPTGSQLLPTTPPPAGMMMPQPALLPPGVRGMTLPYVRPNSVIYAHPATASMSGTYRTFKSSKSAGQQKRRRRAAQMARAGQMDVNQRQRRHSDANVLERSPAQTFQYTGLDRAIADNFLARQEQSNAGSHVEYTSTSSISSTCEPYGSKAGSSSNAAGSRPSSKAKIICRDVKV